MIKMIRPKQAHLWSGIHQSSNHKIKSHNKQKEYAQLIIPNSEGGRKEWQQPLKFQYHLSSFNPGLWRPRNPQLNSHQSLGHTREPPQNLHQNLQNHPEPIPEATPERTTTTEPPETSQDPQRNLPNDHDGTSGTTRNHPGTCTTSRNQHGTCTGTSGSPPDAPNLSLGLANAGEKWNH